MAKIEYSGTIWAEYDRVQAELKQAKNELEAGDKKWRGLLADKEEELRLARLEIEDLKHQIALITGEEVVFFPPKKSTIYTISPDVKLPSVKF